MASAIDALVAQMPVYTIIGKEYSKYTSKKTGKEVNGCTLHLVSNKDLKTEISDERNEGSAVKTEWVSSEIADKFPIGSCVVMFYSDRGFLQEIIKLDE